MATLTIRESRPTVGRGAGIDGRRASCTRRHITTLLLTTTTSTAP